MKTLKKIKGFLSMALALAGFSGASAQILISGTDFNVSGAAQMEMATGIENIVYTGAKKGEISLGVGFAEDLDYEFNARKEPVSSHFHETPQYGITNNPIKLDSLDYLDDEVVGSGGDWSIVFSPARIKANKTMLQYKVGGLKANSTATVVIEYRSVVDPKLNKTCANGGRFEFKVAINADQANLLQGKDVKQIETGTSASYTDSKVAVGADGIVDIRINAVPHMSDDCHAFAISKIEVYGDLDPEIYCIDGEEVCVGEQITLKATSEYFGATYQWYMNGTPIAGATKPSYLYELPPTENKYEFQLAVTVGAKTYTSNKVTVEGITCCMVNGAPASRRVVYHDDFGEIDLSDKTGKTYKVWDYTDIKNPVQVTKKTPVPFRYELDEPPLGAEFGTTGPLNDGYYCVAGVLTGYNATQGYDGAKLEWANRIGGKETPIDPEYDHSGKLEGCCLFLNCPPNTGGQVLYERTLDNLCAGKQLFFECYISVFTNSAAGAYNPVDVTVRLTEVGDASNVKEVRKTATRQADNGNGGWTKVQTQIFLEKSDGIKLEIVNNKDVNENGNDLVVDDIIVRACAAPSIRVFFDPVTLATDTISCIGDDVDLFSKPSEMLTNYFGGEGNTYFLYQWSLTPEDKKSWKNVKSITQDLEIKDMSAIFANLISGVDEKVFFRVIAGTELALSIDESEFNEDNPCANYTISEPIEAVFDCPKCTEPLDVKISSTKKMKEVGDVKVIELCSGESTTLTTNDITPEDGYADYIVSWYKGSLSSLVDGAVASPAVTASPIEVKWEDATEEGVTYIVSVIDRNFPDSKTCWKYDSVKVIANPVPEKTLDEVKPFCEGTLAANEAPTLTIDGYKLHWYEDADTTKATKEPSVIDKEADEYEYFYVLEDSKTGCKGEVNPFAFTVNAIPTKVLEDAKVIEYIKGTGSVDISEKAGLEPTKEEYTLFWSTSAAAGDDGSKTAPKHDITKEDKVGKSYYVYQKNEETGCYGEKSEIVVIVNDSPKPVTKDTVVCKGKTIDDLSSLAKRENEDYELLWYASESDAKEDGVGTPSALTAAQSEAPGEYIFYVAQKNTKTGAISEKAEIKVTVVGVDKPKVVEKAISYCANDEADDLENNVIKTEDASKFLYQDGFQWFVKDAESEEFIGPAGSKPEVNTSVQATVPVTYGVRQVYTIPSTGEQCIGADIEDFTVKTTFLDKPTVLSSIDYMKDDINAANSFDKNILTQNSSAVKHNSDANEFIWYDSEGTLIGKGGEGDAFSPTPKSDPEKANNGIDQSFTYLVSQTDGKCESEKATVEVNILATPKPNTKNVELCEGQLEDEDNGASVISIKDLVDINTDKPGTKKDDFVLVWYDKDDKPISEPVLSSEMSEADGVEKTIIYKVSQKPVDGGAESAKSTIEVTVKARAKLDPEYLPNVCETTVDLKDGWVVANDVKIALEVEYTDAEGTTFSSDRSVVNKSGEYSVTASFDVVTLDKPAYACISNMEKIDVRIDTLQDVKIVGTETTCPNTAAEELRVELYENVDDATIKYKWSGKIDAANAVKKEDVSTEILEGVAGDKFDFTVEVTAGTCTKTSPKHTITLGDGPVVGSIMFTEKGNTDLENGMEINVSSGKATLYTCGTTLTMNPTALENTNEEETPKAKFEWTSDNGSPVGSAEVAEVKPTEKTVYRVTYINKCATFVDITVIPVPLEVGGAIVGADICENESASIDAQIQCIEKPESIKWSRNGEAVSKYDGEGKLVFEPAKPEDSGKYTCVVTNRACVRTIEPLTLLVKPYVKFAPEKEEYVIRRGETVNIINTITVPSDAVPAEITWTDNGKAVENSGKDYSVEVTKDMNLNVEMTEEGKYCPSDVDIVVKVDAVLQLAGEISDANMGEDGNYKMCLGETKTLVIDTAGTGKFVYPEKMSLAVTESQAGGSSRVLSNGTLNSDGKLEFKISPSTDATYSVSFVYREGEGEDEQTEELEIKITVLQKIEVKVPNGLEVCEGEEVEIALESVTPKGTVITWEDETIEGGKAEGETVVAKPTFSKPANGGHVSTYTYTAYASFDICETAEFPVKVKVNEPLTGELEDVTICENETARLDASSYKATSYIWTSDELETERSGQGITVTPKSTAVFKVSMERGGCKAEDELTVTVNPNPLILQVDSLSYRKIAVVVDATHNGKLTYRIDDGAESSFAEFDSLAYAPHVAYVTDEYGCSSSFDFMINAPLIIPNKWMSPNGDGETDRWEVPAISETYPDAKIVIYDRFGKKLIEYKGSDPGWDGVYNGQLMPTTDYWYEITVHEIDKVYTGHFTLLRR